MRTRTGLSAWRRALACGLAIGLGFLMTGDGVQGNVIGGIDPLEVLKLQVKNNAMFVFDTSGSMKWPIDIDSWTVGADDPMSRAYQAKRAVEEVIAANSTRMNFGIASYNNLITEKTVIRDQDFDAHTSTDGPFLYVSTDAAAAEFAQPVPCRRASTATPLSVDSLTSSGTAAHMNTSGSHLLRTGDQVIIAGASPAEYNGTFTITRDDGDEFDYTMASDPSGTSASGTITVTPVLPFFCENTDTYADHDSTSDGNEIWRSFRNPHAAYPSGCTAGTDCRYYLESRFYFDDQEYHWNTANSNTPSATASSSTRYTSAPAAYSCPNPPAGLTGNNPDADGNGTADQPRPCVRMCNDATGNCANYYYTSSVFQRIDGSSSSCGGAAVINTVAACTGDNSAAIQSLMRNELLVDAATGGLDSLTANTITDYTNSVQTPSAGLRFDQSTPIGASLSGVRTASPGVFPSPPAAVVDKQRNFVIFLTDGDDTCSSVAGVSFPTNAQRATSAAREAEALYYQGGGPGPGNTDPTHQAETLVIAFASAVDLTQANKIAQAGSGGNVGSESDAGVTCPADVPCRNAFAAANTAELVATLNGIIDEIAAEGTFSAAAGIVGTVFELVVSPASPLDPNTRYSQRVNLLFQSTFDLPAFDGGFAGYRNDGTFQPVPSTLNAGGIWEAGDTLYTHISDYMKGQNRGSGRGNNLFTFQELHADTNVDNVGAAGSQALVQRRVFTSAGHGRFVRGTSNWDSGDDSGRNVVALWPPSQANLSSGIADVDPALGAETAAVNALDAALGIGSLTFAQLKSQLGACDVSANDAPGSAPGTTASLPSGCASSDLATARKEARQILLAYAGGAQVARGTDGKPLRLEANSGGDEVSPPLLFKDRGWLVRDQTFGQAAVVTPPLRFTPNTHVREWILFRDGRRGADRQGINEIDLGFGLRNPDYDDSNPETKLDLKPRMTVVYVPLNDGLHAYKAETSEELWTYVPWDQLSKIKDLAINGQKTSPHTYMIASSVRVADIFVPGTFSAGGVTYAGRWRTVIVFGRGAGGKYYTALDVTSPGPYTRDHLATNPPWVLWSRGNPDVDIAGAAIRAADTAAYATMGQTWSTPAVGNVSSSAGSPEWRMWMGSGYATASNEGTWFYQIDAETGDVIEARNVGNVASSTPSGNALVANPTAFNAFQLDAPNVAQRSPNDYVSRVYIPDLHGRIWKFAAGSGGVFASPGALQPIADALALLKVNNVAHVYAGSGNDNRVAPPPSPTPPFKMYGYKDTAGDADYATAGTSLFTINYPSTFRCTSQPGTAYNASGNGRVFFLGTKFNPSGASCLSSFDSILFAVGAESGNAAYDFSGDAVADISTTFTGKRMQGPQMVGGAVVLSEGGSLGSPPPPGVPTNMPTPAPPTPAQVTTRSQSSGSPVCRQ